MGLNLTHGAWGGGYSAFMAWREKIAEVAGFPPLRKMEGFGGSIKWDEGQPLYELLNHSYCDGDMSPQVCKITADALTALLPKLSTDNVGGHIGNHYDKTKTFIAVCMEVYEKGETLEFF